MPDAQPELRTDGVRFRGYRPCPARPEWVELVLELGGEKLTWCLPFGEADEASPPGGELRFLRHDGPAAGLRIEEVGADGQPRPVSAARALFLLAGTGPPRVAVDERLTALHA
jgi:hypothetical protein